ncbi:MAG: YraN family protein [Gemmatimonadota bacterium]|jgi:putative endonuclease|nr:YraN family protein [Gemmatimonadota bacterium]
MNGKDLGIWGERVAAEYFQRTGWRILECNFRAGRQEIDLIVRRGRTLAFVEVKTRRDERFGHPFSAIVEQKRQAIQNVAQAWIARFGERGLRYRFDVISIIRRGMSGFRMQHLEDAWGL